MSDIEKEIEEFFNLIKSDPSYRPDNDGMLLKMLSMISTLHKRVEVLEKKDE